VEKQDLVDNNSITPIINNANIQPVDEFDFAQDILNYIIHKKLVGKGVYSTIWEATDTDDPDNKYVAKIAPKKKISIN